ncbi:MAG: hypothetical protein DHS20C14_11760 [Phycisphaeraceae bacterium]|nr:MAG: hypothetical protein DHS20C14_11760 [Phycisphaeraceae bacterium]
MTSGSSRTVTRASPSTPMYTGVEEQHSDGQLHFPGGHSELPGVFDDWPDASDMSPTSASLQQHVSATLA